MENQTKDLNLLWKMVKESFGNAVDLCDEINDAAIELAVTPLEECSDYKAVQRAIWVMLELRKCFEVMRPDTEFIGFDDEDEDD